MLEQGGRKKAGHDAAPRNRNAILHLPDMAHQERSLLDVPRPAPAQQFVALQGRLDGAFA